jgi:N-acetylglutamate synthase-like GNAT family acetyltransferase
MNIIFDNSINIIEINYNNYLENSKIIKDLKKLKNEMCKRKETLKKDSFNIDSDFYLDKINKLNFQNISDVDEKYSFGFVILQKVFYYNIKTIKPTAVLIVSKKDNIYIIEILCKHENAQKGLGTLLLKELINKAKKNNISKIFLESTNNASEFYKKLHFVDGNSEDILKYKKHIDCKCYLLNLTQDGGFTTELLLSNNNYMNKFNIFSDNTGSKMNLSNDLKNSDFYLYLFENQDNKLNINAVISINSEIHITGKRIFLITDFRYSDFNKFLELINIIENIALINNFKIIQFEFKENNDLLNYLLKNNYFKYFVGSEINFLRKLL